MITQRDVVVMLTGHTETGYCQECKVTVEPNSSLEDHQRSRKHINRLLQLGLEVPISCMNETEENKLPEGAICLSFLVDSLFLMYPCLLTCFLGSC